MDVLLSLDYDCVTDSFIIREAQELARVFSRQFDVWESSERHYHIRAPAVISPLLGFEIMDYSRCSSDYKAFCRTVGCFPIRIEEKNVYRNGVHVLTAPKPKLVYSALPNGTR
jgi:hypothetical protein